MHNNIDSELVSGNGDVHHPIDSESTVNAEPGTPMHYADSREDMFEDASDELSAVSDGRSAVRESVIVPETKDNSGEKHDVRENHYTEMDRPENSYLMDELELLRSMLKKTVAEKDSIVHEYEEERKTISRELSDLRHQLKLTHDQQATPSENDGELVYHLHKAENGDSGDTKYQVDTPLHNIIHDCSNFLRNAQEKRLQGEGTIRELNAILFTKDQEIEDLNAKITEMSLAYDVTAQYFGSVQKSWSQFVETSSEVQVEKDQHIAVVMNRVLASLSSVVNQEEVLDDSVSSGLIYLENGTSQLIENYNQILYEINQLTLLLTDPGSDQNVQEFATVLVAARDGLLDLKIKERDLVEKVTNLEYENGKLVNQLDKDKDIIDSTNAELKKLKMDLEQEKLRSASTKEKLSLAVTKGKALVQQRDSLKQSLADKANELEKYSIDLQEKSAALEVTELRKEELINNESLSVSLQNVLLEKNIVLQKFEDIFSQIDALAGQQSMDIIEKLQWVVDERNVLKMERVSSEALLVSQQETLSQRNLILEKIDELLQPVVSEELHSTDIMDRLKWLVDEKLLKGESLIAQLQEELMQRNAIIGSFENSLSHIGVSEEVQLLNIVDKFKWLVEEKLVKGESLVAQLQEELMQRNAILEKFENLLSGVSEEVQLLNIVDKFNWLVDEKLVKGESLVAQLQEELMQRNAILENFENLLSHIGISEEVQLLNTVDKFKWLVDEKLVKGERLVAQLQEELMQRNAILENFENLLSNIGVSEEVRLLNIGDKFKWLVDEKLVQGESLVAQLQDELMQRNAILENFENILSNIGVSEEVQLLNIGDKFKWLVDEKLVKDESLVAQLQEELMQRNAILEKFENLLPHTGVSEEVQLLDIVDKFKWLVDEKLIKGESLVDQLQEELMQRNAILENFENLLSHIGVPEEVQLLNIVDKFKWLVDEKLVKGESLVAQMQDELMQRNAILEHLENLLSHIGVSEEVQLLNIVDKFKWLVDEKLVKGESLVARLQEELMQRNAILENFENLLSHISVSEKVQLLNIVDKFKWLVDEKLVKGERLVAQLQEELMQRNAIIENFENLLSNIGVSEEVQLLNIGDKFKWLVDEKLVKVESLVAQLQEELMQRNAILEHLENLLSHIGVSEEVQLLNIVDKVKWLVDEKLVKGESLVARLQEELMQRSAILENFENILSHIGVSEEVQLLNIVDKFKWLVDEKLVDGENLVAQLQEELKQRNAILEKVKKLLSRMGAFEELQSFDIVDNLECLVDDKLVKNETLVASLQEELVQKNVIIEKLEEILSSVSVPEGLQSIDIFERCRWLVDERIVLTDISLEFQKLRDSLYLVDFPDPVSSSNIEFQVGWLRESFYRASDKLNILQDEIARIREAANKEIDHLTASLVTELQEKSYLKTELDDMDCKYEEAVAKVHQVSVEKDQMVKMLVQVSGATMDVPGDHQPSSDIAILAERCIGNIKEKMNSSGYSPHVDGEFFESIQSLLYVKSQDLVICESILEEEMMVRSEVNNVSNDLKIASQELKALNEEKASLQKDLERSEEKSALLREKLSMAVKKGKGLVQDRENLKHILGEKNSEIEKLRLELQHQEALSVDFSDKVNSLSADLENIPKLEANLTAMTHQKNKLEQFLEERNKLLDRVFETIDCIVLAPDSVSKEPVEKVKWLAGYFNECQDAKTHVELEVGKLKEEATSLTGKLVEAQTIMRSLEDALSVSENKISQLIEEKKEFEIGKAKVEEELHKAMEEARSESIKFAEVCETKKSIQEALLLAEGKISVFMTENEEAQVSRSVADSELVKVKEEMASQSSKLAEAYRTIQVLEDTLLQVDTNVAVLTEKNNEAQVGRINLENEITDLQDQAESLASQLEDAGRTIKSLEDSLLKAENDISLLESEKKVSEQEISTISCKLNTSMEELAGRNSSLEIKSVELIGNFNDLQMLMKDKHMFSAVKHCFEKKFESLKNMDLILQSISDHIVSICPETLQNNPLIKEDLDVTKLLSDGINNIADEEMETDVINTSDDISSYPGKIVEGFQVRNKILAENIQGFSTLTDEVAETLFRKLRAIRDGIVVLSEHVESSKQNVKNMEVYKKDKENTIAVLENDVTMLLSACMEATRDLQFDVVNNLMKLSSVPELQKPKHTLTSGMSEDGEYGRYEGREYSNTAENLLFATKKVQALIKQFESTSSVAAATIEDLQSRLEKARTGYDDAIEERDINQKRVSELETEVEALEISCSELRIQLQDYEAKEEKLHKEEAELSSMYNNLLIKEQEEEHPWLSRSQVKILLEKISRIEVPYSEKDVIDSSSHVTKLFHIIDHYVELVDQKNILSHDKEKLQSSLSAQILEIERMKEEVESYDRYKQDSEKLKNELAEFEISLEKTIAMLGGKDLVGDETSMGVRGLLAVLEKEVMAVLLESDKLKSKAHELDMKLLGSHQVVDELTTKVKVLEDSVEGMTNQSEIVLERSMNEAPSLPTTSEISEIEDVGALGKTDVAVPSAAHVRAMRKGSTDHLAININHESTPLINNEETVEDKGHIFKSLNASGLIPKQGKLVADRIDGIWVSGGRILMNRPDARLGLIAYWLFLHLWLLGTIL